MKPLTVTFLLGLTLLFARATSLENATVVSDSTAGITVSLMNYHENDALTKRLTLAATSDFTITVTDVAQDIWFIVLQIHTYEYGVTLAYNKAPFNKVSSTSLFGSNIGLYLKTYNAVDPIQVLLTHDNAHDIDGLLVIVPYGRNAPIPGGCNMEFDIEISPYQKLNAENDMITVDTQPGAAVADNGFPLPCEKQLVQHTMYRLYLPKQDFTPNTYFEAIASMVTPQDIMQNGDEIPSSAYLTSMRHVYSAYTGVGSVYAAVATYRNHSSAYVPIFTYACSPLLRPKSCQILNNPIGKVICALALIIGLFSICQGYKYGFIDRWLPIFMISSFVGYTMGVASSNLNIATNLLISLIIIASVMVILNVVLSTIRRYCDNNTFIMNTIAHSLPTGFLCACVTYLYAPANWFFIMENDQSFWSVFVCITVTATMLLMITTWIAKAITYTIFSCLFVILAIDYFAEGSLKYIFIVIVRRIIVPGFHSAFVYPPYQGADKALVGFWILLMTLRFVALYRHYVKNNENRNNLERERLLPNAPPSYNSIIRYPIIPYVRTN